MISRVRARAKAGFIALVSTTAACASGPRDAAGALGAFDAALARHDTRAAYALMSNDYRARVPYDAFTTDLAARVADAAGPDGRATTVTTPDAHAELVLGADRRVPIVWQNDGLRFEALPLDAFPQNTPRAALRSFLRALERGRYDVLVRFAPAPARESLNTDVVKAAWQPPRPRATDAALAALAVAADAASIDERGDHATLTTPSDQSTPAHVVRFVREADVWRIDGIE